VKEPEQIQTGGVNQRRKKPTQDTSTETTDRKKQDWRKDVKLQQNQKFKKGTEDKANDKPTDQEFRHRHGNTQFLRPAIL